MFDVSFAELIAIAVIALLVIGPEKLPKVARTLGALTGRMQKYVAQIKEEVNREVRFQELQQLQQEIQETVTKTKDNIQAGLQGVADTITQEVDDFKLNAVDNAKPDQPSQLEKVPVKKTVVKKPAVKKPAVKKPTVKKPAVKKDLTQTIVIKKASTQE
ncbi:MAG: twin-arginine translocase subunit TatB [Betaproteobacteria bacterium HGW-Betaproteobacteria-20]|nr:MAG: twin-arginine translocase subunit TatB [Betaproteobacteria bacterium HGW-Betaproteobacteria-20]